MLIGIVVAACGSGSTSNTTATPAATYSISGTVTLTGAALSGVTVTLGGASTATATTDASGNYSFAGLANGSYTVTPTKTGSIFTPSQLAVSVSGNNVTAQDFTATTSSALTYSISGSTGIAGTTISLGAAGSTITGTNGAYNIPGLIAGSYTVTPTQTGYTFSPANAAVTINTANVTGTNFVATLIPVPHSISGNVSGATAVTITVTGTASPPTVTTDSAGNYTVGGLYDGSYTVAPSKAGYSFSPLSLSVPMAGADVPANDFVATVNTAVTATVSGTITGSWVEGVTVTMTGGGATTAATTNGTGNYSFANVPSGATYTFTPSLAGYTYSLASQSVAITAGSSAAVTVPAMTAASTIPSYSITGTVSYPGSKTGPIAIFVYKSNCLGCNPFAGTTLAATALVATGVGYTIRGLVNGSYVLVAGMDALGTGKRNATNPKFTSATVTILNSNAPTTNLALADPATTTPVTPTALIVQPGDSGAFITWQGAKTSGIELSDHYNIYWGTDPAASNLSAITVKANDNTMYVQTVSNGGVYYYKISALVNGVESAASAVVGQVTIGAVPGPNTVSGAVTFPGTATGPLTVGVYDRTANTVKFTRIANPVSPQAYTVTGVANGTYNNFATIDMNNNGLFDSADVSNTNGAAPSIVVSGNTTGNITLTANTATAVVNTQLYSNPNSVPAYSGYNLDLLVTYDANPIMTVTLISGLNLPLPLDLGRSWDGFGVYRNSNVTPSVGQSYKFRVTYADASTKDVTDSVSTVFTSSNLPQNPAVSKTTPGSGTVPQFSWTAPVATPASYTYQIQVSGNGANWWMGQIPSATLSALYNANGNATPATLTTGTYNWQIGIRDAKGSAAMLQAPNFTTP